VRAIDQNSRESRSIGGKSLLNIDWLAICEAPGRCQVLHDAARSGREPMRRYFTLSIVTTVAVLGIWRAWPAKSRAADEATPAGMSAAEWRYFNSQPSHWRQAMLKNS
jgi:hypothetical protein